jgi:hypothetical protein
MTDDDEEDDDEDDSLSRGSQQRLECATAHANMVAAVSVPDIGIARPPGSPLYGETCE